LTSLLALAAFLFAPGVVLLPGSRLHLEPDARSQSLTVVDVSIEVAPLEERDGWILVTYDGYRGWVRPGGPVPLDEARGGEPPRPPEERPDLLAEARAHLAGGGREIAVERWRLLTDVSDEALLARIQELAMSAPERFRAWWKLPISTANSGPAIVLFSDARRAHAVDPLACGRVRRGVVTAGVVEGDPEATLRSVFHLVGHLYVSLAILGPAAPPWVEEGLADSFAELALRGPGMQEPLGPAPAGSAAPPLATVLKAGRELFADDEAGKALRHAAVKLSRFLWNSGNLFRYYAFRSLLEEVGRGTILGQEEIERGLRTDVETLERGVETLREPPPNRHRNPWRSY